MASMAGLRGASLAVLEGSIQLSDPTRLGTPASVRINGGGRAGLPLIRAQLGQQADVERQSSRRAMLGVLTAGITGAAFVNSVLAEPKIIKVGPPPPPSGGLQMQAGQNKSWPATPTSWHVVVMAARAQAQRPGQVAGGAPLGRRTTLELVVAGLAGGVYSCNALAEGKPAKARPKPSPDGDEENGLWLPGLIPIPTVNNKINNPETGTRSFVQLGVYVANIGAEGSAYRLRQNAFDLLGWGDLLGKNAWNYLKKYLQLKSTIMYYDFDTVITGASDEQKQPLTDLANRLFTSFEKLEEAVKMKDDFITRSRYDDTTVVLKEVMDKMDKA